MAAVEKPRPLCVAITLANGDTLHREIPVTTWLSGKRKAKLTVPPGNDVTRVEIDPLFPDAMPKNDIWDRETDELPASWPLIVRNDLIRRRTWALEEGFKPEGTLLSGSAANGVSEAQVVWDTAMAVNALEYLEKNTEYSIIVLSGNGHALKWGIPEQIRRRSMTPHTVIIPHIPGDIEPGSLTIKDVDYIVMFESIGEGTIVNNPSSKTPK